MRELEYGASSQLSVVSAEVSAAVCTGCLPVLEESSVSVMGKTAVADSSFVK